ncbi:LytR/AlgR family response regulator transcription factor [Saccharicrinis sp. FJH62]|uniref:LytR/AlgR family response regulator transcription factor n=1 Tax=Saccharicrinis sp. FJH62 TaxID=3344657 RepID=UPI0035D3D8BC
MSPKSIKCLIVDDEAIARDVLENHLSKISSVEITGICKNALEAFNILQHQSVDLMFLDINMPEISGLSLAKTVSRDVKIIFTTAYREYAVDGFDLKAVDYLLKPISFERLLQSVQKYFDEQHVIAETHKDEAGKEKNDFMFVRSDRKMIKINFSDIVFIESLSDYLKIHTTEVVIVTRETLSNIEAVLPQGRFLRVHRSYIVAPKYIDSYTKEYLEIGKNSIPISRSYKKEVMEQLEQMGLM